jgi:hypothetical protein
MKDVSVEERGYIGTRVPVFVFDKAMKEANRMNVSVTNLMRSLLYPAIGIDSPEVIDISKRYGEWAKKMSEENQEQEKGEYIGFRVPLLVFAKVTQETSRLNISMSNFVRSLLYPAIGINNPEDMKKVAREYEDSLSRKVAEKAISKIAKNPMGNILLKDMEETFAKCLEIAKRKNNDYAGEKTLDPYKNFRGSDFVKVPPPRAILVRIMDKISRISNLLEQDNAVKDESINDTLNDVINYFAILQSYLKNNK